jgi:hypothetical protein
VYDKLEISFKMAWVDLKDLTTFNSSFVMLGMEDLDFTNIGLIFHLNSMPSVCGSSETTDSTEHMSRLGWSVDT